MCTWKRTTPHTPFPPDENDSHDRHESLQISLNLSKEEVQVSSSLTKNLSKELHKVHTETLVLSIASPAKRIVGTQEAGQFT